MNNAPVEKSHWHGYGTAVAATVIATLLRLLLDPLIGNNTVPFITYFPAVLFASWWGGFRSGLTTVLISALAADYLFIKPAYSFSIPSAGDRIALLLFGVVGVGIAFLSHSQRQALDRANRESALRQHAQTAEKTGRDMAALNSRLLAAIVDSLDDAVIATDLNLKITSWNRAAERIFGYSAAEAVGQSVRMIIPKGTWHEVDDSLATVRAGQKVEHYESRRLRKDTTTVPVSVTLLPLYDSAGVVIGASKIVRDTSERNMGEERFRLAVEGAPAAMIMTDSKGIIVLANPQAERLLGYERHELIGLPIDRLVPERFRRDHLKYRTTYLEGASQRPMGAGRDLYAVRKNGTEIPVEIGLSPIQTLQGTFVISAVMDITERKRTAELESQAKEAADKANRAKDDFLTMLSHELRNPLSSILGWSALLKTGKLPPDRIHHALEIIERNARAEAQLVESILDLSRITAGTLKLDKDRVDLSLLVTNMVDSQRPAAELNGLTFELSLPPAPLLVAGDPGRLQQVLSNLLSNAVKFTPHGGRVRVQLVLNGSKAELRIGDTGEGIDPDFLPHVFDRFRQADSSTKRQHGGLGMGLAIVRELVHAHGGNITAESPGKGKGATFTMTLPIPAILPEAAAIATLAAAGSESHSISGMQLLVVDDDADARDLLTVTLESLGAKVDAVQTSAEALTAVRFSRPDVMIADIGMPLEDGYTLIQQLRALEVQAGSPRLPAIAFTAYASTVDRDQALAAGFDFHLPKPVVPSELRRAIAKFRGPKQENIRTV